MTVLWDKKLIKLSNGSYISWGLKRKKFSFSNKNELKLNCAIIEYYEEREKCDEKVISDYRKIVAERNKELDKLKGKLADLTSEYYELENLKNDEIAELKEKLGDVQMQKAGEKSDLVWKLKTANEQKAEQLTYAKTIIQDLLDNTDEYARQRAEDFLKENK